MKIFYKLSLFLFASSIFANYDATIVGYTKFADGIGRHAIGWIECLQDDCKINFIQSRDQPIDYTDVPPKVAQIISNKDQTPGKIIIFVDMLGDQNSSYTGKVPNGKIKFAFSMIESTALPKQWVEILNKEFDAVLVPDDFLVEVYKSSGVNIPIFVLPWGAYLEDFLSRPIKTKKNKPFKFGMSSAFYPRKNQALLIDAFAKAFGNNHKYSLVIHGRGGPDAQQLLRKVRYMSIENIYFIHKQYNRQEYANFMASLDCYVFPSKGEGFSITPREALALGIPCILSNNTAHKTICSTGFVRSIISNKYEAAFYDVFGSYCGYQLNTTEQELINAMKDVYKNYDKYLKQAHKGRTWVSQYLFCNLKKKYVSLVKPKKVILGDRNIIDQDFLMTNSKKLYDKYLLLNERLI